MIEFQNVSYTHSKGKGVNNLNFKIEDGDFVFLIGPTGSGKTTLMRLIYFDLLCKSGTVKVDTFSSDSMRIKNIPQLRRNIGMVFQDYHLLEDRDVFNNVALPLHVMGYSSQEIPYRVEEALDLVGFKGKRSHYPSELSGGEKQRVTLARAIVKDPDIILADEPTGNLDPSASDDIIDLLENESKTGTTIIMATHNYPLIENRIKYFLEINDGKLVQ